MTREQFTSREIAYWNATTPVGYVFGLGAIMGLIIGGVIVYQILFADVSRHLGEYATLKAIGYSDRALGGVVLRQSALLSVLGFAPGLAVAIWLYRFTAEATRLPMVMTAGRSVVVLFLTLAMCGTGGLLALRKVRTADPAEVFG